jgi:RES domain-containing protein
MEVFRLCRKKHCNSLDGKGSALYGSRWNSPGIEIVYTAANRSLAMAEVAVHISLAMLPDDYYMMTIFVPESVEISVLDLNVLPNGWNFFPYTASTRKFGDKFIAGNNFCILKVPSAVTMGDSNYLINPHHSEFAKITISAVDKFPFDRRIFMPNKPSM